MPKGVHHHNPPALEFTTYKLAGDPEKSAALRAVHMQGREDIRIRRLARLSDKGLELEPTVEPAARCGYPKRRERDEDMPSKRKVPFSHFTRRFRTVGKKIEILHATRGWKAYA